MWADAFVTLASPIVVIMTLSVCTGRCGPCCSIAPIVTTTTLPASAALLNCSRVIVSHFFNIDTSISNQSNKYAIGVTIIMVKIVRSIQITINFGILTGISVAKIQGMSAEKNRIADTDTTAVTNSVINGASTTSNDGKNISAISIADAFAANNGSGTCINHVNG